MTTAVPSRVTHEVELHLVVPGDASLPVPARLAYDARDPYAVRPRFSRATTRWSGSLRDLLASGVDRPVGEGDVHVWRAAVVLIALIARWSPIRSQRASAEVASFVDRTYELVAAGDESRHVDVETAIARLLAQDAWGPGQRCCSPGTLPGCAW